MPNFSRILERVEDPKWRRRLYSFQHVFDRLLPLGGMSEGNRVEVFTENDQVLEQMISAIEQAKKRVWLETYIYEPDSVGLKFREALINAAKRGCEVIFMFDHFGSSHLNRSFLEPLRRLGAEIFDFNPIWPWRRKGPLLFRDHRKILVVDDLSFCGSMNITLNPGKGFRDTVMKVQGPATHDLAKLFLNTLAETTGKNREEKSLVSGYQGGVTVQVLASNQRRKLYSIQSSMDLTLKRAKHNCYFTTPYFLPYDKLRKTIIEAAERGVDVRILTAGLSDIPLMRLASQHVYEQFLKAGVRIYEMLNQTLHAKTATIDGVYAWVGSYNLDHWSARRNLEVNTSVIDRNLTRELESHFESDLKNCREISLPVWKKRSWFRRIINFLAYQIMRL